MKVLVVAVCLLVAARAPVFVEVAPSAVADPQLVLVAGNEQIGLVQTALADSLAVQVIDRDKRPIPSAKVGFQIRSGGGRITRVVTTDSAGIARAQWTLGRSPGRQTVRATVGKSNISFVATANAPANLALVVDTAKTIHDNIAAYEGPVDERFRIRAIGKVRALMVFVDFSDAAPTETIDSIYRRHVPKSQTMFPGRFIRADDIRGNTDSQVVPNVEASGNIPVENCGYA